MLFVSRSTKLPSRVISLFIITLLLFARSANFVLAADGYLDPTFGNGDKFITDFFIA
jgi:hypothetical protein